MEDKVPKLHEEKIALSLSAFILPGLGQLYLKKRIKGWLMIFLSFSTLIFAFAKFMMGVLQILNPIHQKREALLHLREELWQAFMLQKFWMIGACIFIGVVWLWSILDIRSLRK